MKKTLVLLFAFLSINMGMKAAWDGIPYHDEDPYMAKPLTITADAALDLVWKTVRPTCDKSYPNETASPSDKAYKSRKITSEAFAYPKITWVRYNSAGTQQATGTITATTTEKKICSMNKGDYVILYGTNKYFSTGRNGCISSTTFTTTTAKATFTVSGNVMSLLVGNDATTLKNTKDCTIEYDGCFGKLFCPLYAEESSQDQTPNKGASNAADLRLPAKKVSASCYDRMFLSANKLTAMPPLPDTVYCQALAFINTFRSTGCTSIPKKVVFVMDGKSENPSYEKTPDPTKYGKYFHAGVTGTFARCASLTDASNVEVKLTDNTQANAAQIMFQHCGKLAKAPKIISTYTADYCYGQMFQNCSTLVNAPYLPAQEGVGACYHKMFNGCSKLNNIKIQLTSWKDASGTACCPDWVTSVAASGTIDHPYQLDGTGVGTAVWPSGWTKVNTRNISADKTIASTNAATDTWVSTQDGATYPYDADWHEYVNRHINIQSNKTTFNCNGLSVGNVAVFEGAKGEIQESSSLVSPLLIVLADGTSASNSTAIPCGQMLVNGAMNSSQLCELYYKVNDTQWYPLSLPFTCTSLNGTIGGLREYDGAQRESTGTGWKTVTASASNIAQGKGYCFWAGDGSAETIVFRGTRNLSAGDQDFSLAAYNDGAESSTLPVNERNWNLIGNPYMASLSDVDIAGIVEGEFDPIMKGDNWTGGWNWKDGVRYVTYSTDFFRSYDFDVVNHKEGGYAKASEFSQMPFGCFFVQSANGANTFAFEKSKRALGIMGRNAVRDEMEGEIILTGNGQRAHTGFLFGEGYSDDFDDNADLGLISKNAFAIYGVSEALHCPLAYTAMDENDLENEASMKLGYQAQAGAQLTFALSEDVDNRFTAIWLDDAVAGTSTNLLLSDYTVTVNKKSDDNRFSLRFSTKPNALTTELSEIQDAKDVRKMMVGGKLLIKRGERVYNAMGGEMYDGR